MGDLSNVGNLAMLSSAVGGASQVGNAYAQAGAIRAQGRYAQDNLQGNAQLADMATADASKRGSVANSKLLRNAAGLASTQKTAYAGQGVDVTQGSAAEVQADTAHLAAEDARTLQSNAYREGWGHQVEAMNYRNQARMGHLGARNDANMTLLTGGLGFGRDVMNGAMMKQRYERGNMKVPTPDENSYWTD